jgi:hypothetical protein
MDLTDNVDEYFQQAHNSTVVVVWKQKLVLENITKDDTVHA